MRVALSPTAESVAEHAVAAGTGQKCPRCAEVVKRDAKVCRFCQYEFDKASAAPATVVGELERECPNCHRMVFHTAKRCAFCRTPFTSARAS
jgi:RNA polymerase subunit RPABC4/transcription elongation factor Spt4